MTRLENWSMRTIPSPFGARFFLAGNVYGYGTRPDGSAITTSELVSLDADKMEARCFSRTYALGTPSPDWVEWLKANGFASWRVFAERAAK